MCVCVYMHVCMFRHVIAIHYYATFTYLQILYVLIERFDFKSILEHIIIVRTSIFSHR